MSNVICMSEYIKSRRAARVVSMQEQKQAVGGSSTRVRARQRQTDRALRPIINTGASLYLIRDKLMAGIKRFGPDHLIMPATKDLDPYFAGLDVDSAWFNSLYPPLAFLHYMLQQYTQDLVGTIHGTKVETQSDYHRIVNSFNNLYIRGLEGRGRGIPGCTPGLLSEDQAIRMAALFYAVLRTTDLSDGIQVDSMGHFCNRWSERPRTVTANYLEFRAYADRLKDCYFAGLSTKQFLFRALPKYKDTRSTWLFDLSDIDILGNEQNYAEMDYQELVSILDLCSSQLSSTGHQTAVVLPYSDEMLNALRGTLPRRLHIDTSFGRRTLVVTNYKWD